VWDGKFVDIGFFMTPATQQAGSVARRCCDIGSCSILYPLMLHSVVGSGQGSSPPPPSWSRYATLTASAMPCRRAVVRPLCTFGGDRRRDVIISSHLESGESKAFENASAGVPELDEHAELSLRHQQLMLRATQHLATSITAVFSFPRRLVLHRARATRARRTWKFSSRSDRNGDVGLADQLKGFSTVRSCSPGACRVSPGQATSGRASPPANHAGATPSMGPGCVPAGLYIRKWSGSPHTIPHASWTCSLE